MALGARVRERRKALGWTQEELARRAGLAQPTLQKIEAHDQSKTRYAGGLARALGVPVEALLGETNWVPDPDPQTPAAREASRLVARMPSELQDHLLAILRRLSAPP